jgi:hypothetical protein
MNVLGIDNPLANKNYSNPNGTMDLTPGFNITRTAGGGIPFISKGNGSTGFAKSATPAAAPGSLAVQPVSQDTLDSLYGGGSDYNFGGGSGGVTQGVNDAATLASYDQSINNTNAALGRLNAQRVSGYGSVDASLADALKQLGLGKSRAEKTYKDTTLQTGNDFVSGKNTVRSQSGAQLSGLLRFLGSRGAGGSSTARIALPQAVAQQASLQQGELTGDYGKNMQSLDTNWGNYLIDYGNEVTGAKGQAQKQKEALDTSIETNRANLLQTIAALTGQKAAATGGNSTAAAQPFLNQANSILNGLSNYSTKPIEYTTKAYDAPELSKYTSKGPGAITVQGQGQAGDYTSPYLQALLKKRQTSPIGV